MAKKYLILAFALMVGVQLLFPLKMIIEREIIITKGQTFLFKIRPIDPYDAFRGRYVSINYEENPIYIPESISDNKEDDELYVTLKADNMGRVVFDKVYKDKPTDNDIYLKTNMYGMTYSRFTNIEMWDNRYYMNEYKAPIADMINLEGYAQVAVYKGKTVLKGILIEGMPIEKYIDKVLEEQKRIKE